MSHENHDGPIEVQSVPKSAPNGKSQHKVLMDRALSPMSTICELLSPVIGGRLIGNTCSSNPRGSFDVEQEPEHSNPLAIQTTRKEAKA